MLTGERVREIYKKGAPWEIWKKLSWISKKDSLKEIDKLNFKEQEHEKRILE